MVDLYFTVIALVTSGSAYNRFRIAKRVRERAGTAYFRRLWIRCLTAAYLRSAAALLFVVAAMTSSGVVFLVGLAFLVTSIVMTRVFSFSRPRI